MKRSSSSQFLDFVTMTTRASQDHPGPLLHYRLASLNHIIDVSTPNHPTLSLS
ncbi:hypothetical protein [Pseudogemmobacter humi]|uniref:Uncharacterized protein n=1 Tax=Pseudogemmobacter humi TaxID=2483812 RepID=A0A3P5XLN2_9RHOB|nr:hypothetical protein [Pseudogemmobacter humi]VDC31687.1 hypothetical protein XINFAN_03059 [Pseudogemmobacter humi]